MNASAPRTSTSHRLITTRPFLKHIHSYNSPSTDESPFHSIALLNLEKDNPLPGVAIECLCQPIVS